MLNRCLELNPEDAWAQNFLGLIQLHQEKDQEAYGYFQKALQVDDSLKEARANLVVLYEGYGNNEKARETLRIIRSVQVPVSLEGPTVHPGFSGASSRLEAVAMQVPPAVATQER